MADPRVQHVSTIISAKWICPVRPHNITLEDHSIVIDQDQIIDIIETKKVAYHLTYHNPAPVLEPYLISQSSERGIHALYCE